MTPRSILRAFSLVALIGMLASCACNRQAVAIKPGCVDGPQWGDPCPQAQTDEATAGSMYHFMRSGLHLF